MLCYEFDCQIIGQGNLRAAGIFGVPVNFRFGFRSVGSRNFKIYPKCVLSGRHTGIAVHAERAIGDGGIRCFSFATKQCNEESAQCGDYRLVFHSIDSIGERGVFGITSKLTESLTGGER